ncbi:MAG: porin [Proteobacteria bacterium]|nr:porin [Pseudomonadota bacterium]
MKKLLVGTAAIALGFAFSAPAQAADGIKLGVGGHFKGYVTWLDQDENTNLDADAEIEDVRDFDILRETEIHMSGETTLDNGLTVGFHLEAEADGTSGGAGDTFDIEESYAYFSGAWGRVNFGAEDGAAFLLQVAAPSADTEIDGVRQQVQPVTFARTSVGALAPAAGGLAANFRFDYDNAIARSDNKLTYMTPVFNGFQFGASYTPDLGSGVNTFAGINSDDTEGDFGEVWEVAGRFEGTLGEVGVALGAGYADITLEDEVVGADTDDRAVWNAGIDLNWGAFGLGAAYLDDDHGRDLSADETVWVVGADYTTGPFKIGASYYDNEQELDAHRQAANSGDMETDRWMAGVTYTYGPGMTFRGSVGYVETEMPRALIAAPGDNETDATFVMLGTVINF